MAVWLVRAGQRGERQDWALEHSRAVVGWNEMGDLSVYKTKAQLMEGLRAAHPQDQIATVAVGGVPEAVYPIAY